MAAVKQLHRALDHLPHVQRAFYPTRFTSVVEWALERVVLPDTTPEPGPLNLRRTPYIEEIAEAMILPEVRVITAAASRQVGKTILLFLLAGWTIDQDPSPLQYLMGRDEDADTICRDRFAPILKASPMLWQYVRSETRDIQKARIALNGAHCYFDTAGSLGGISSKPLKRVCADELHLWPRDVKGEGSPLDIISNALTNYEQSLEVRVSTPTDGRSLIQQEYELGDQREYYVACPHCEFEQILKFEQIRAPEGINDPLKIRAGGLAWYECAECAERIDDWQRLAIMGQGRWIQKHPVEKPTHRSYKIGGLYSPWRTFSEIKAKHLECGGDPLKLKVFTNTVLGEVWKDSAGGVEIEIVSTLEGMLNDLGRVPAEAQMLVGGADWHGRERGIFWSLWAFACRRRVWLVDYGRVVSGAERTPDWFAEVAGHLDEIFFEREWIPEGSKRAITPWLGADSGYKGQDSEQKSGLAHANQVYDFCRPRHRAIACKGEDRPRDDEMFREFKSPQERKWWNGLLVNTGLCKKAITAYLNHGMSLDPATAAGESNYIQLANGTGRVFMEHMGSEECVRDAKGNETWPASGPNHWWDSLVDALAVASYKKWQHLREPARAAAREKAPAPARGSAGESGRFRRPADLKGYRRK